jgi:hypothetical protein
MNHRSYCGITHTDALMNEEFRRAARALRASCRQVSLGHLLSPANASAVADSDRPPRWGFRIHVLPEILRTFRAHTRDCAVTSEGLQVGNDEWFWVIGYQARRLQQRMVLPLVGPTVAQLLGSVAHNGLLLVFDGLDAEPRFAADIEVPQDQCEAFRRSHRDLDGAPNVVAGIRAAASLLRDPHALPPADGMVPPVQVSIAVILPPELVRGQAI